MDKTLDNVENGYRLCILVDLNAWIGDRERLVLLEFHERMTIVEEWWSSVLKRDCV